MSIMGLFSIYGSFILLLPVFNFFYSFIIIANFMGSFSFLVKLSNYGHIKLKEDIVGKIKISMLEKAYLDILIVFA